MRKQIKIIYLKKADKFLRKNKNILTEEVVDNLVILAIKKKIFDLDVNIDVKNLKGELQGKYRIRKGKIRIIIEIEEDEVIIQTIIDDINFRGEIYK